MAYAPTPLRGRPVRVPAGLILPIGPSGSGNTNLARRLVRRGLDPSGIIAVEALAAPGDGFDVAAEVRKRVDIKLRAGATAYVDGTNLARHARRDLVARAHAAGRSVTALLRAPVDFDELAVRANANRRTAIEDLVGEVTAWHRLSVNSLEAEGFDRVEVVDDSTDIVALPSGVDWRTVPGPFAVIGDIHGCYDTLMELLDHLGFDAELNHPEGLFPLFVGDFADKGGRMAEDVADPADIGAVRTLRFVLDMLRRGRGGAVYANHERKLARKLAFGDTPDGAGVGPTLAAVAAQSDAAALTEKLISMLPALPTHLILDDGHHGLIVAHAGIKADLVGRNDKKAQNFCLYTRDGWQENWERPETVVHGHVIQDDGPSLTRAPGGALIVGIDTGAYEGGGLSAYRSDTRCCVTVPTHPEERASEHLLARYREEVATMLAKSA